MMCLCLHCKKKGYVCKTKIYTAASNKEKEKKRKDACFLFQ